MDEESFRSDLERDSAHSSMTWANISFLKMYIVCTNYNRLLCRDSRIRNADNNRISHEHRWNSMYEELQRQGNLRTSMEIQKRISQQQRRHSVKETVPPKPHNQQPILNTPRVHQRSNKHLPSSARQECRRPRSSRSARSKPVAKPANLWVIMINFLWSTILWKSKPR